MFYIPVNNFSVMLRRSHFFLGIIRRLLLIIFDSVIAYRDISGTTKPIDVNSTLCAATLTLRIIKRVSKKGVMITATNNQF